MSVTAGGEHLGKVTNIIVAEKFYPKVLDLYYHRFNKDW